MGEEVGCCCCRIGGWFKGAGETVSMDVVEDRDVAGDVGVGFGIVEGWKLV